VPWPIADAANVFGASLASTSLEPPVTVCTVPNVATDTRSPLDTNEPPMSPISVVAPVIGSTRKTMPSEFRVPTSTSGPVWPSCVAGTYDRPLNVPPMLDDNSVVCAVLGSTLYTDENDTPIMSPV
jgi:hypothetical protein